MPRIKLEFEIESPIQIVFDLSRSVDLHKISTKETQEEAIAGITSGLMKLNDTVTWRAKHFGVYQKLTSQITAMRAPYFFTDEMIKGAFSSFKHDHIFEYKNGRTIMTDIFMYKSPLGILGQIADKLFLKNYMIKLLTKRNLVIKEFAENDKWKQVLDATQNK